MAYYPKPYYEEEAGQNVGMNTPQLDTWRYGSPADYRKALQSKYSTGRSYSVASGPTTSRSVSRTVRSGSPPEKPDLPEFVSPEYDKRRVSYLTQQEAAPGIRRLRESVQEIVGRPEENPNVKRMTLRAALQGYGTGLESVMAGAARAAETKYQTELGLEREEAMRNWEAQVNAEMAAYNAAWQDYLSSGERITETTTGAPGSGEASYGRPVRLHGRYGGITMF